MGLYYFVSGSSQKAKREKEVQEKLEEVGYDKPLKYPTEKETKELGEFLSNLLLAHGYT